MDQISRASLVREGSRVTIGANVDAVFAQLRAFGNEIERAIVNLEMPGAKQNKLVE